MKFELMHEDRNFRAKFTLESISVEGHSVMQDPDVERYLKTQMDGLPRGMTKVAETQLVLRGKKA